MFPYWAINNGFFGGVDGDGGQGAEIFSFYPVLFSNHCFCFTKVTWEDFWIEWGSGVLVVLAWSICVFCFWFQRREEGQGWQGPAWQGQASAPGGSGRTYCDVRRACWRGDSLSRRVDMAPLLPSQELPVELSPAGCPVSAILEEESLPDQ